MHMTKRICIVFVCLAVLLLSLPMQAKAATGNISETFQWSFSENSGTLTITGFGEMPTFAQYADRSWDAYVDKITKVVISEGITSVGNYAFYGHDALEEVQLPVGLISIGKSAFYGCSLKSLSLPDTASYIGENAFYGCDFSRLEIPDSVITIEDRAFSSAFEDGAELVISASVRTIGINAFGDNRFSKIDVAKENPYYYTDDQGVLYGKSQAELIKAPTTLSGTYHVAEGTKVIRYAVFDGVRVLDEIILPSSVTIIDDFAFSSSSIKRMTIPDSVTSIGQGAFFQCTISEVVLPNNITDIPESLFMSSSLDTITIPKGVTRIGRSAFMYCDLEKVEIPEGVIAIENGAFAVNDELKSIFIPGSVTEIGSNAFLGSSAELVITVDPENEHYCVSGSGVLMDKSGKTIVFVPVGVTGEYVIAPNVEVIAPAAFAESPLTVIAINGNRFSVGTAAFTDSSLQKIYLGEGLTLLDGDRYSNPFDGCESLTDIYYGGSEEQWRKVQAKDLDDFPEGVTVHYNVSYEEFREEIHFDKADSASSARFPWWAVILVAAVLIPGTYLWIIKRKGGNII